MSDPSEGYSNFNDIAYKVSRTNACSKDRVFNYLLSDLWDGKFDSQKLNWNEYRASLDLFPGETYFDTPLPPLYNAEKGANDQAIPLEPHESIAKLVELTTESLVQRANAISGGERLTVSSGKDALTKFLLTREIKKPEAEAAALDAGGETVFVTDSTATPGYPKRKHEIIVNGSIVQIEFEQGKPTEMPYAHGMKFLHIESFEVKHRDGTRIPPLPNVTERANGLQLPALRADEVIVNLDELTAEALVRRSNAISGGEKLSDRSGRATLIAFLQDHGRNEQAPAARIKSAPVKPARPLQAPSFAEAKTEDDVSKFSEDTTEGDDVKQHRACLDYPQKTSLWELFDHLFAVDEPRISDAYDEAGRLDYRRLAQIELRQYSARGKVVLRNVAIPDDEVCRFCDWHGFKRPKSYDRALKPETQPSVSPHEVPSPRSRGRPTYRTEIKAAYEELRDDGEIDFKAPKNRIYDPIREKVRDLIGDPFILKGLRNEAIRIVISPLFDADKAKRTLSP